MYNCIVNVQLKNTIIIITVEEQRNKLKGAEPYFNKFVFVSLWCDGDSASILYVFRLGRGGGGVREWTVDKTD